MPKDNENIPLFDVGPLTPTESPAFAPEELVSCEKCHRPNPPTRANCLYCGTPFKFDAEAAAVRTPDLRPLEKWESGYNNITDPAHFSELRKKSLAEVADLIKLTQDRLERILELALPLPLARSASLDEAQLIEQRLAGLGVPTRIVADSELGLENSPGRLRSLEFSHSALLAHQTGGGQSIPIPWADIRLLVKGRLRVKKVAVRERKAGRNENEILESSETHADEALVDIYSRQTSVRIAANSFDFSCLGADKSLIAQANFNQLLDSLSERALSADFDDSYDSVRQLLEQVWKSDVHTESRGWRRERPGKLTLGALTQISNEVQFTRYSRLRNHVLQWW